MIRSSGGVCAHRFHSRIRVKFFMYHNIAVVKIDSSPLVRFYQNLNGIEKVYVYLPRKSAKYSDHSSRIVPRGLSVAEGP